MKAPTCTLCGQSDQRTQVIEAFGRPWKHLRICNICGYASDGASWDEAWAKFQTGNLSLVEVNDDEPDL